MACCSEYQTECLRVVTIAYLKSFIGSDIQNSSGAAVSISRTDDTYCPTYGELTNGSIIPYWSQGGTPNGDRDGIIVNPIWVGDGVTRYRADQLVDQRDLSMMYTRFKSFSVNASPRCSTEIDECGGLSTLEFFHKYTRYTQSMTNGCATASTSATCITTTSVEVSDTANSEVTWTTSCAWANPNQTTLVVTVDTQPATRTAPARSCTVTGNVRFRGTDHSDTVDICQKKLTGSYSIYSGTNYYDLTVTASTTSPIGCCGGDYGLDGTGYYYDRYLWKDSCGRVYYDPDYNDRYHTESLAGGGGGGCISCTITGNSSIGLEGGNIQLSVTENSSSGSWYKSGSFSSCDCCSSPNCCDGCSDSDTLTITWHGLSKSANFTQSCAKVTTGCCPTHDVIDWSRSDSCNSSTYGSYITIRGTRYDVYKDSYGNCTQIDYNSGRDYETQEWCCISCSDSTDWDESACDGHCGESVTQTGTSTTCYPSSDCKDCNCSSSSVSRTITCPDCPPEPCTSCTSCSDTDGPNTHHQMGINDTHDSDGGCSYVISVKWCVDKLCNDSNCPNCCTGGGNDVYVVGKESSSWTWSSPLNSSITCTVPAKPSGCA